MIILTSKRTRNGVHMSGVEDSLELSTVDIDSYLYNREFLLKTSCVTGRDRETKKVNEDKN